MNIQEKKNLLNSSIRSHGMDLATFALSFGCIYAKRFQYIKCNTSVVLLLRKIHKSQI